MEARNCPADGSGFRDSNRRIGRTQGGHDPSRARTSGAPQQARADARSACAGIDLRVKLEEISERSPVEVKTEMPLKPADRTIRKRKIDDSSEMGYDRNPLEASSLESEACHCEQSEAISPTRG